MQHAEFVHIYTETVCSGVTVCQRMKICCL